MGKAALLYFWGVCLWKELPGFMKEVIIWTSKLLLLAAVCAWEVFV